MSQNKPMEYNPLVYYWIAYYNNGKALPQFNPINGVEHQWSDIDLTKLVKFGLYPFQPKQALLLFKTGLVVQSKRISAHEINIHEGQRLIFFRRQFMERFTYRTCHKCGHKFKSKKDSEFEIKVVVIQNEKEVPYLSYACPKCKSYNVFVCPTCNQVVNKVKGEEEGTFAYECPRCLDSEGKPIRYPRWIERSKPQMYRYTQYMLGFQETIKGQNIKSITMIDENGNTFTNWDED